MQNIIFLISAYGFIWLLLAYYFFATGKQISRLEKKVDMLISEKEENIK